MNKVKTYLDEATRLIKKQLEYTGFDEPKDITREINALQPLYNSLDEDEQMYVDEEVLRLKIHFGSLKQLENVEN